jgi:hypothetical protein
MREDIWGEAG